MLLAILMLSSLKVIYINIKYFNIIKEGQILDVRNAENPSSDGNTHTTYCNLILINKTKDTISGGSQKLFRIGDNIKLRYRGKTGANIYEVNGEKVASKYDIWDLLSPIVFVLTFILFFGTLKAIIWKKPMTREMKQLMKNSKI